MSLTGILLERAVDFIPVLLSLTVHEWAHAWTAMKLGDDTAKLMGRVSLNPLDHIDPVGTLLLPLLGVPFGWAKPVPVNPLRFRSSVSMSWGLLLTAAAGPLSNLALALLGGAVVVGLTQLAPPGSLAGLDDGSIGALNDLLVRIVLINIVLASFNLLPIPPLDGSRIAEAIVPDSFRPYWNSFAAMGPFLLILVILAPQLLGGSILELPVRWTSALLFWATGGKAAP